MTLNRNATSGELVLNYIQPWCERVKIRANFLHAHFWAPQQCENIWGAKNAKAGYF